VAVQEIRLGKIRVLTCNFVPRFTILILLIGSTKALHSSKSIPHLHQTEIGINIY
jgi:hypothetical protein